MSWIQTFSGKAFTPLAPKAADVELRDIAHALSNLCRFTGHPLRFYSVAEHSVRVSRRVGELTQNDGAACLWALLHDASEAYLGDLVRPLKHLPQFAFYREAEARLQAVICERFGLPVEEPELVRHVDAALLATERVQLMGREAAPWNLTAEPIPSLCQMGWLPAEAMDRFIHRFHFCVTLRNRQAPRGAA